MPMSKPSSFPSRWRYAFVRTPHRLDVDGISPTSVAVGLVMSEWADWRTGGNIRPGRKRIASVVGISVPTVTRSIAALSSAGWLATDQRGSFGLSSVYRLTIPSLANVTTGVITGPVSGSPMSHSDTPNDSPQWLTGALSSGSPMSHQLSQYLSRGRSLRLVAA